MGAAQPREKRVLAASVSPRLTARQAAQPPELSKLEFVGFTHGVAQPPDKK